MGVSALVCVLLMFFFPLPQGNFQATHGPTTALRSRRASLVLVFTIIKAALQNVGRLFAAILPSSDRLQDWTWQYEAGNLERARCVMRC